MSKPKSCEGCIDLLKRMKVMEGRLGDVRYLLDRTVESLDQTDDLLIEVKNSVDCIPAMPDPCPCQKGECQCSCNGCN